MRREKTIRLSPLAALKERGQIDNLAKSAVRALDVLELLVTADGPLREIDIARALSMSPSSADQILKSMVDSGYLLLGFTTKHYRLSPRLMRLVMPLSDSYFPQQAIDALMRAVHRQTKSMVLLAAPQNSFMQIIDVREDDPQAPTTLRTRMLGMHTPFFGSCTGAAWLSMQDEETLRKLIRKFRRELGPLGADIESVLQKLRQVRDQGYAFGGLMADEGMLSVAVPLPPAANGLVMILVVAGAASRVGGREATIAQYMKRSIERYVVTGQSSIRRC